MKKIAIQKTAKKTLDIPTHLASNAALLADLIKIQINPSRVNFSKNTGIYTFTPRNTNWRDPVQALETLYEGISLKFSWDNYGVFQIKFGNCEYKLSWESGSKIKLVLTDF